VLTPIQQALAKLAQDAASYEATAGSLSLATSAAAAAKSQVDALTLSASTAAAAVAVDQAALAALMPGPSPPPGPGPVAPRVSLVVVGATWCAECNKMHGDVDALKTAGMKISRLDTDVDPTASATYRPVNLPTTVALYNGKEITRHEGGLSKAALADWMTRLQAYAAQYLLPPAPKAEP
jgi:thiol-disulfide isomerase/thioredoxin